MGIPASRGFSSRGFATRRVFRGSNSNVLMGSGEPVKFAKRVVKPDTSIKRMIFCNLWVQNDKYDCNLLNFMGSK